MVLMNRQKMVKRRLERVRSFFRSVAFDVVFQPVIDHSSHHIVGYEVLSRPKYKGRSINPEEWFRAAVQENWSVEADLKALSTGIQRIQTLNHINDSFSLFVNVLPSSLLQEVFIEQLSLMFERAVWEPDRLVLEIVEYENYDFFALKRAVSPLRSHGVQIALDDLGLGSASLGAMIDLEPDLIKVDRSLIQDISTSSNKQRMLFQLSSYIGNGNAIIAEGVETQKDLMAVENAGVHLSQGYYWARPMSADMLHDFVIT